MVNCYAYVQMVRLLLREGAYVDVTDARDRRPLHWATYMGHSDVIRDLIHCGANVNTADAQVCQLSLLPSAG